MNDLQTIAETSTLWVPGGKAGEIYLLRF